MLTLQRAMVAAAALALLGVPRLANAGGWWSSIDLESSFIVMGERVEAHTEFLFRSIAAAERARRTGPHYVYLIQDFDYGILKEAMSKPWPRGWWSLGEARSLRVGTVVLSDWDGNLAQARAAFVVPDIPPGRYALMFCDSGCVHPLGDIVPTKVTVVADPLTARLKSRFDKLGVRTSLQTASLRAEIRDATSDGAERILNLMQTKVAVLQGRIERLESDRDTPWLSFTGWLAAGALLGALATSVLVRRKHPTLALSFDDLDIDAKIIKKMASSRR